VVCWTRGSSLRRGHGVAGSRGRGVAGSQILFFFEWLYTSHESLAKKKYFEKNFEKKFEKIIDMVVLCSVREWPIKGGVTGSRGHGVTGSRGHQPNHDYQIINFGKLGITTI